MDKKISQLTPETALSGDEIPVNRSGANYKITAGGIAALAPATTPGGSDTQVQFNDGGAFGGDAGLTFNKTTDALTAKQFTPATGTITTSLPAIDATQTWNAVGTTFTGLKFNATDTASAAGSLLMDLQVGGARRFGVRKSGAVIVDSSNLNAQFFLEVGGREAFNFFGGTGWGNQPLNITAPAGLTLIPSGAYFSINTDVFLVRDAADTFAQRRTTNAQTFRIYGTFTDASNSRRLVLNMSTSGVAVIKPEGLGTGVSGNVLHISGLPTSNPGPGILWDNGGSVEVGT